MLRHPCPPNEARRDPNAPQGAAYERPYKYHIKGDPIGRAAFPKPDGLEEWRINNKREETKRICTRGRMW